MFGKRGSTLLLVLALVLGACARDPELGTGDAGGSGRVYSDNGVSFTYPSGWDELDAQSGAHTSGSNQLWTATVGPGQTDLVNLSAYQLSLEVTEDNIGDIESEIDQVIQGIVAQAHATVSSGPEQTTIAGFPAYKYEWTGVQVNDEEKSSEVYLVFDSKTEYFFNCQFSDQAAADVTAGCHMILDSFETKGNTAAPPAPS
jgi:hypothetical protein